MNGPQMVPTEDPRGKEFCICIARRLVLRGMILMRFPLLRLSLLAHFLGSTIPSIVLAGAPRADITSKDVLKGFAAPPKNCSVAPIVNWSERLEEAQVRSAL